MCVCVSVYAKTAKVSVPARARLHALVFQYAPQSRVTIYPGCKKVFASRLMRYVR